MPDTFETLLREFVDRAQKIAREEVRARVNAALDGAAPVVRRDRDAKPSPQKRAAAKRRKRPGYFMCWARGCGKKASPFSKNWCKDHAGLPRAKKKKIKADGVGKW